MPINRPLNGYVIRDVGESILDDDDVNVYTPFHPADERSINNRRLQRISSFSRSKRIQLLSSIHYSFNQFNKMFGRPYGAINSWNQDYQTVGYGNYGYGIYSQDVEVHRNPFTGRVNIERDLDFVPLGGAGMFNSYRGFPYGLHQHYHQ